jgi:hypothetical protein
VKYTIPLKARCFVIDSQVLIQRQLRWPVKALVYERLLFVGKKKRPRSGRENLRCRFN